MDKVNDLIYTVHKKMLADDVTMFRKLRPSVLLRLIQEISIAHTEALGAGRAKTLDKGVLWVVARMKIEINRLPSYDETVTLESWAGKTMRVLFPRYYEMLDESGNTLVKASAVWLLMDEKTRHMAFPEEYGVEIPSLEKDIGISLPCGVSLGTQKSKKNFVASYSRVDINGHMNNSKYVDEAEDLLGAEYLATHEMKSLEIEFKSEIKYGAKVCMEYTLENDELQLIGLAGGVPCFELIAKFRNTEN